MNLATTLLFYLLFGTAVAVAVYLSDEVRNGERWFRAGTAIFFWPLYVPSLLQGSRADSPPLGAQTEDHLVPGTASALSDDIVTAIRQVEAELDLALNSLDGWSESLWSREERRFDELRSAWYGQAQKIQELDALLENTAFVVEPVIAFSGWAGERVVHSERARQENIAQLRAVRARLHNDLFDTLAWVRELVTRIHLAKYTGAPATRAEELVLQIATAVEGLSEVAGWKDDETSRVKTNDDHAEI